MDVLDAIVNINTVLILLAVGTIVWVVRQIMPDHVESTKLWRVVLRILPVGVGMGIAMIPQLRPMADNLAQSAIVGGVAGSFSSTLYEVIREALGTRIKAILGSPQNRKKLGDPGEGDSSE
jgi:hypothetical protein